MKFLLFRHARQIKEVAEERLKDDPTDPDYMLVAPTGYRATKARFFDTREAAETAMGDDPRNLRMNHAWGFGWMKVGEIRPVQREKRTLMTYAARKYRSRRRKAGHPWDFKIMRLDSGELQLIRTA